MSCDPRTTTGIPTEQVGSLPRPSKLQAAYADYDAGKIKREQLDAEQEEPVRDSIKRLEATGSPIISDGEQRWSSFATYPITFSIDVKPNHGSPDYARDVAFQKITNRVKGTKMAAEKLNVG